MEYRVSPLFSLPPDAAAPDEIEHDEVGNLSRKAPGMIMPQNTQTGKEIRLYIVMCGMDAQLISAFSYAQARYWGRKFLKWRGVAIHRFPVRCCVAERKSRKSHKSGKAA